MDGMNKEKWNAFSVKQKIEHIWYYYKVYIIVLILVVAFGVAIIDAAVNKVEPQMTVVMFNTIVGEAMPAPPDYSEFLAQSGYENYDGAVRSITNYYIYKQEEDPELYATEFYNHSTALINMMYAGALDVVIGRGEFFVNDMVNSEVFVDLRTILPEELLEEYKDSIVYGRILPEDAELAETESTECYPCAIYLKNNAWVKESGFYNDCYIAIPKKTTSNQVAIDFLMYLLQQ